MPALTGSTSRRAMLAAMASAIVMVACGSGSSSQPTSRVASTAFVADGGTAWQTTLDEVGPQGQVSLQTALAAFALAIGPVPGAVPTPGTTAPIASGTIAVDWVLADWSQLSPTQQAAVMTDLGVPAGTSTSAQAGSSHHVVDQLMSAVIRRGGSSILDNTEDTTPNPACQTGTSAAAAPYQSQANTLVAEIRADLGSTLTRPDIPIYVVINAKAEEPGIMYSYGCGSDSTGEYFTGCMVHINPGTINTLADNPAFVEDVLIHELTHCVFNQQWGDAQYSLPPWFGEGAPTWTDSVLGVGDNSLSGWWRKYLSNANKQLFSRTYDGLGYFVHLAETGTDVWHRLIPIGTALLATKSNDAGWTAADPTAQFVPNWGAGYAEGRVPGAAWDTGGPNLPTDVPTVGLVDVEDGGSASLNSLADAAAITQVHIDAQVVTAAWGSDSEGLISLGGSGQASAPDAGPFCAMAGGCVCPPGSAAADQKFTQIESGIDYAAVSGGLDPGALTLTGATLQDYCKEQPCLLGDWVTTQETQQSSAGTSDGGAGSRWDFSPGSLTVVFTGMAALVYHGSDGMVGEGRFLGSGTANFSFSPDGVGPTNGSLNLEFTSGGVAVEYYSGEGWSPPIAGSVKEFGGGGTWVCSANDLNLTIDAAGGITHLALARVLPAPSPTPEP